MACKTNHQEVDVIQKNREKHMVNKRKQQGQSASNHFLYPPNPIQGRGGGCSLSLLTLGTPKAVVTQGYLY